MSNTSLAPALTSLKIRGMKVVLTLQSGQFANQNGANVKTIYSASLPGYLHIDANIQRYPAFFGNTATIGIYGMTVDDCNAATKFNYTAEYPLFNSIDIYAGYINITPNTDGTYSQSDVESAINILPLIFNGGILTAGADFNDTNRPFIINAVIVTQAQVQLIPPTAINSPTNLSVAIAAIIKAYNGTNPQLPYQLRSISPDIQINNAHLNGSFKSQLTQLCDNYGYQPRITYGNNVQYLDIVNANIQPSGTIANILSTQTGMIGYPTPLNFGISAREFFNPNRTVNDQIILQTYYTALANNGLPYYVYQLNHILQTQGEFWDTVLTLYGFPVGIAPS